MQGNSKKDNDFNSEKLENIKKVMEEIDLSRPEAKWFFNIATEVKEDSVEEEKE